MFDEFGGYVRHPTSTAPYLLSGHVKRIRFFCCPGADGSGGGAWAESETVKWECFATDGHWRMNVQRPGISDISNMFGYTVNFSDLIPYNVVQSKSFTDGVKHFRETHGAIHRGTGRFFTALPRTGR